MLVMEVLSSGSDVDWFVSAMTVEFRNAADRAEKIFAEHGEARMAKRLAAGVLGKWYSAHTINAKGYSLTKLLSAFGLRLPAVITNRERKEELEYSSSKNLITVIRDLAPVLKKKGYGAQSDKLTKTVDTYIQKINSLKDEPEMTASGEPEREKKSEVVSAQKKSAETAVMDTIKRLPKEVQHDVRTAVARRGNTLAALADELNKRNIKLESFSEWIKG